jgi:transglutaminase-like putative cysteine protease
VSTTTRLTWLSALAVLLTTSSLWRVFDDPGLSWLPPVAGAVVAAALAGLLARRLQVPALAQPVLGVLAVGLFAAVLYAQDTFAAGLVPGSQTLRLLGTRIGEGLLDIDQLSPPVPTTPGLVLLTVLGAGAAAVLADLLAVGLRRPALAGLPLLVLLVVPAATLDGGVGVVPFALGAAGWLALLMADNGERAGRWGTALRSPAPARGATRADDTSLGRVGRRIGVAALGTALVVPALLPGLESSLVDGGGFGGGSRTTTTYNPLTELGGQLRLPEPRNLLRYTTTDPAPDYLRLTTLDRFDDQSGWSSSELSGDLQEDAVDRGIPAASGSGGDAQPLTARILVQALGGPWLPIPPVPSEVDVDGPWLWDAASQTVFSTRTDVTRLDGAYEVRAERVLPDAERLQRGGPQPTAVQEMAAVPEVTPFVREVTASVLADAGAAQPYERAMALQAYFRGDNGFTYSEDASVPGVDAPNALEAFLRGKQGFCEQYASAMAAMARLAGLPARVAVGFTPGSQQPDGTWQVTTDNAHAWPEIWFAGHGWVRFEPTPRSEQVTTPDYTVPPAPGDEPDPSVPETPTEAPATPGDPLDPGASGDNQRQLDEIGAVGAVDEQGGAGGWLRAGLIVVVVAALLAVAPAVAALRRRRRWAAPGPDVAWAQVREDAVDVGHRWRPADSPRTAATHLTAQRGLSGTAAEALQRLAAEVERARYARPGSQGAAQAAQLHDDVAAVRSGLLRAATRRTRWTARWAPPSTLRAMMHASGTAVADLLDRLDELTGAGAARVRRIVTRRARSA